MSTAYRKIEGDLLQQTRWGWALVTGGGEIGKLRTPHPCGASGFMFRKHIWKGEVCRRCKVTKKDVAKWKAEDEESLKKWQKEQERVS